MAKAKKTETKPKKAAAKPESKGNLLQELAKRKAEAQASGQKKSQFGKDLSSKIGKRDGTYFVPTKPGGRNGQGKP